MSSKVHHLQSGLIKMFKKCLCSTGSTGKRRKLSYLLTLSYYLHLQWLDLGFPAYNENSHFCLSTPHLSVTGLNRGHFHLEHCTGISNSTWPKQNLSSLYLQFTSLCLQFFILKFSVCTITHHEIIASSSPSPWVLWFYYL